jgi:3-hydroxyacyl-[acyl-carrier-protein] dehydratase
MTRAKNTLKLGTNAIELLVPHSRPLLLVDQVLGYRDDDLPELQAAKYISSNEPVFAGHFPELHLWPGVYTIEGMGQSCNLLYLIRMAREMWSGKGGDPDEVLDALRNLELGTRLHPGYDPALTERFAGEFAVLQARIGVSSAVEVKLLKPVFAGCRLDYEVRLLREIDHHVRFEVTAAVERVPVARGTLTSYVGFTKPARGPQA